MGVSSLALRTRVQRVLVCGLAVAALGAISSFRLLAGDKDAGMWVEVYQVGDLPVWHVSPGNPPRFDGSLLVAHLEGLAPAESWKECPISVHPSTASLVIRNTRAVHDKISDAIDRLHEDRKVNEREEAKRAALK